ncbi:glycosyltransferase family 2 protein [Jannaschia ovalis]|uniref:Glycosyltransferase family 2 protein n=1 Tax=Jannaschia ovalis TaxID=3038773 RepID=A0ABY8LHH9_9RHOB|nr:glycosyltransferase family 2 protein [Jannaschia sp. GRR-S6-38]WGH79848.1 glycosyltransferase family 2 protein [Jannaschia sp. GRR-S6-38]
MSISIPAYEMAGMGAVFLGESFERLTRQTFRDFEVVVSDQSENAGVRETCAAYDGRLDIRVIDNRAGARCASANVNTALDGAAGEIRKVLFQDDLVATDDALEKIEAAFASGDSRWSVCGSTTIGPDGSRGRALVPRLTERMRFGRNTVSSPSVLAVHQSVRTRFDEGLVWLMDVDFYDRAQIEYGPPVIVPDCLILNRIHDGQVSASVDTTLRKRELKEVFRKRPPRLGSVAHREYLRQRLKAI